jgi:hypothetical protein
MYAIIFINNNLEKIYQGEYSMIKRVAERYVNKKEKEDYAKWYRILYRETLTLQELEEMVENEKSKGELRLVSFLSEIKI